MCDSSGEHTRNTFGTVIKQKSTAYEAFQRHENLKQQESDAK